MISFALSDEQQLLRETAQRFAREVLRPGARRFEREGLPGDVEAAFWQLGLLQVELEEGLPEVSAVLVKEELAWGCPGAALALWAPHLLAPALRELGSKEQRERLLAPFLQPPGPGRARRGAVAYAERWKSRIAGFATTATPTASGYSLTGTKSFVINAPAADLTVVFAQVNPDAGWDGVGAFCVEGRPYGGGGVVAEGAQEPGDGGASFRLGDRHELLGLSALPCGELCFEDHPVPEEHRLRGPEGGASTGVTAGTLRLFARAQLHGAAHQVGLARAAYELALDYTQERRAFGKPVAHFQAVAFTLADLATEVDAARWLLWRAAAAADGGALDLSLCAEAAVHAADVAFRVADSCVQLLGGAGYMEDFPAEKWLREAKALGLFFGTSELHQQIIAAEALGHSAEVEQSLVAAGAAAPAAGAGAAPLRHGLPSGSLQPFFT